MFCVIHQSESGRVTEAIPCLTFREAKKVISEEDNRLKRRNETHESRIYPNGTRITKTDRTSHRFVMEEIV